MPADTRRSGLIRRGLLLVVVWSAVLATGPATGLQAQPRPTVAEVARQVDALDRQVEMLAEDYDASGESLAGLEQRLLVARGQARAAQRRLAVLRARVDELAASAYRGESLSQTTAVLTARSPSDLLAQLSLVDQLSARQQSELAALRVAQQALDTAEDQVRARVEAARAVQERIAARRRDIEGRLARREALLQSLRADERRRLEAARRAALVAGTPSGGSSQSGAAASRSYRRGDLSAPSVAAAGQAGVAVRTVLAQVGDPYRWGATGPDAFDCSGLTMFSWGRAGVSLPHSSQAQWDAGRHVSRGEIQPGDLVFYGSPIHHVGIYVGGGRMVSATHTGDYVRVQPAFRGDFVGAVRP